VKLSFASDIHVHNHKRFAGPMVSGINTRCRIVLDTLRRAVKATRGSRLYIPGDLFDIADPTPQVMTAVMDVFNEPEAGSGVIVCGNHDQVSMASGDNALGPLKGYSAHGGSPLVVADAPMVLGAGPACAVWVVPFAPGKALEWLPRTLSDLMALSAPQSQSLAYSKVLVFHLGIADEKTHVWLRGANDSIDIEQLWTLLKEFGIDAAFAGNWHNHRVWKKGNRKIVQVGTLCPTGFDNEGLNDDYGKLVTYDTDTGALEVKEIPGPRFLKLKAEKLDDFLVTDAALRLSSEDGDKPTGYALFAEISCHPDVAKETFEKASQVKEAGMFAGFEVIPDDGGAQNIAAREAAFGARSAATLDEALAAFVEAMPLEPEVSRDNVLALSKKYLGGAT
jgi:DNA repair exonuclease SbcCD nuclease subunit